MYDVGQYNTIFLDSDSRGHDKTGFTYVIHSFRVNLVNLALE